MRTLTLLFHSLRMEEHFVGGDWSRSRHFYAPDVDLESGALELETGELLGGSSSVEFNDHGEPALPSDSDRAGGWHTGGKCNAVLPRDRLQRW